MRCNELIREVISDEVAQTFPKLSRVLFYSRSITSKTIKIKMVAFLCGNLLAVGGQVDFWTWLLLITLLLLSELMWFPLVYFCTRHFLRSSLAGVVVSERDGIIERQGTDFTSQSIPLSECYWTEIIDLKDQFHNRAFPHQSCVVLVPSNLTLSGFMRTNSFIVCGLTEEFRAIWKDRLRECGAIERPSQINDPVKLQPTS